jgi:hypothetical protein
MTLVWFAAGARDMAGSIIHRMSVSVSKLAFFLIIISPPMMSSFYLAEYTRTSFLKRMLILFIIFLIELRRAALG